MRGRFAVTLGLLGALVLGGCAGSGAEAGDDASPSPSSTANEASTESETESAHAGHHHHDYSDFPVEIALEPTCVAPGGTTTLTVDTVPRSGVLYLAYFSDGKSGASEAWGGGGYGGNGGGYADESGTFVESWTITEETPAGPGRLRVLTLGDDGEEFVDFAVAKPGEENC